MNNKEILEKAIQKAIDGGWLPYFHEFDDFIKKGTILFQVYDAELPAATSVLFGAEAKGYIAYAGQYRMTLFDLIFNHDFAKALFGNEPYYRFDGDTLETPTQWQYHLQQMVIAEDPIKYLGENI